MEEGNETMTEREKITKTAKSYDKKKRGTRDK
jgi:hypothetical protein